MSNFSEKKYFNQIKKSNYIKSTKKYCTSFFKAQLVATSISLPILVYWGIPISIMTVIGNFIFTPFFTIFLILSSLIFSTELLSIPNNYLIIALTKTTYAWESILLLGKKEWLIGFAKPNAFELMLLIILLCLLILRFTFLLLSHLLAILIIATVLLFSVYHYHNWPQTKTINYLPHSKKQLTITQHPNHSITIEDNGLFNKKSSPEKFVSFELKPYIIKTYGKTTIDQLVINRPTARSFQGANELCKIFTIKKICIAHFKKPLTKYGWRTFFMLKKKIEKDRTILQRC